MPGSMNGLQLQTRIGSEFPHVITVLTSGHLSPEEVPGDTLLIPKPYLFEQVASQLIGLLDQTLEPRRDQGRSMPLAMAGVTAYL